MAASGPLPVTDPVVRALRDWLAAGYLPPSAPLIVACSGGADSLALAAALPTAGIGRERAAVVIDHGLQQGSDEVARATADTLRRLGYRRVEVVPVAVGRGGGMEAAAREARYTALARVADRSGPGSAVLLAHTADDQAETVLLGLARGSGPRSIAGMRPWRAPWGRPLLAVRRTDTERACAAVGIEPWYDPQNVDSAFTRVRLRREVLPLMDEVLGGGTIPALARTAELMADDLAALDSLAARAHDDACDAGGRLDCAVLADWPSAVRRRVLRAWVARQTGVTSLTFRHLVALENIVIPGRQGAAVRIEGGIDILRRGGVLAVRPATPGPPGPGPAADGRLGT